jgi:hypothetical protein
MLNFLSMASTTLTLITALGFHKAYAGAVGAEIGLELLPAAIMILQIGPLVACALVLGLFARDIMRAKAKAKRTWSALPAVLRDEGPSGSPLTGTATPSPRTQAPHGSKSELFVAPSPTSAPAVVEA